MRLQHHAAVEGLDIRLILVKEAKMVSRGLAPPDLLLMASLVWLLFGPSQRGQDGHQGSRPS